MHPLADGVGGRERGAAVASACRWSGRQGAGGGGTIVPLFRPSVWRGGCGELTSDLAVCVWIPSFALRAEEFRRDELACKPTALLAPEDTRRVWQVSPLARRHGVRTGMTVSQAIGLCPFLALCEPDPVYYDEQFARLLLALTNVSPIIEPVELGKVFVGVDGLDRLFGGAEKQLIAICEAIHRSGSKGIGGSDDPPRNRERRWYRRHDRSAVAGEGRGGRAATGRLGGGGGTAADWWGEGGWVAVARLGWARGKFVAWVAAAKAKSSEWVIVPDGQRTSFLATQSVAALPIEADTHHRLWQLGIKTLGNVAKLPEEALVSQFGSEGRRAWLLASGITDDPVVGRPRPEPIVAALDYLTPVADRGMLAHAVGLLIDRALEHPRRTGWRVHTARVQATLENGASWMVEATLKDPSADRERIAAPLRARLETSPPVGAVDHLAVEFTEFARGTDELQLFARDAQSSARAGRRCALRAAANEIKTRLKRSLLYHVVEVHPWSRIPERRYALIDFEP